MLLFTQLNTPCGATESSRSQDCANKQAAAAQCDEVTFVAETTLHPKVNNFNSAALREGHHRGGGAVEGAAAASPSTAKKATHA
jgi:hypothetical protein